MHCLVDKVSIKSKNQSVAVYEVYDGDPQPVAVLKELTKDDFEEGIRLYYDRKFSESSVKFNQVLQSNPQDKAARIYLERCARYMVKGVPEDWTGVEALAQNATLVLYQAIKKRWSIFKTVSYVQYAFILENDPIPP